MGSPKPRQTTAQSPRRGGASERSVAPGGVHVGVEAVEGGGFVARQDVGGGCDDLGGERGDAPYRASGQWSHLRFKQRTGAIRLRCLRRWTKRRRSSRRGTWPPGRSWPTRATIPMPRWWSSRNARCALASRFSGAGVGRKTMRPSSRPMRTIGGLEETAARRCYVNAAKRWNG